MRLERALPAVGGRMILVFELTWDGLSHAPGNSHLVQMIAHAFPERAVRVHGGAAHLQQLQSFPDLVALPNVSFQSVRLHPDPALAGKTHVISLARMYSEFRAFRAAFAQVPHGTGPLLVMLASATSTAIVAARLALRLSGLRASIQVGLHGNLNDIEGWRSRNPLLRALDLRSVMGRRDPALRYLTFEAAVSRELGRLVPAAADVTDSIPLAVNMAELGSWRAVPLAEPLRVGLVGLATTAKGIESFLETADSFKAQYGERVEFTLIGNLQQGDDVGRYRNLAHPVTFDYLPRPLFVERLLAMHYIFLPYKPIYYRLSPSGALIDALTWLKPVIATRVPIVEDLFAAGGDIGHLCDDVAGMQAALHGILANPDPQRYAAQVEALRVLRAGRTPAALGPPYRRLVETGFPEQAAAR
jgi:hypothetical protein